MYDWTTIWIASAVICGLLGALIGSSKGLGAPGLFLGIFLGLLGVIIVAVMKGNQPTPETPATPGGWWPDPYGRYSQRYFDGREWTRHVIAADGTQTVE